MSSRRLLLAAFLGALTLHQPVQAHEFRLGQLRIEHPWARPTTAGIRNGGAYFVVHNEGSADDRLLSVSGDAAERFELHETQVDAQGVARMLPMAQGVPVPAGGNAAFKPGGLHVMMLNLRGPLVAGTKIPVVLTFAQAGAITVELAIETGAAPMPGMAHH